MAGSGRAPTHEVFATQFSLYGFYELWLSVDPLLEFEYSLPSVRGFLYLERIAELSGSTYIDGTFR